MATPRLGLVVEDKPTELSCSGEVRKFCPVLLCACVLNTSHIIWYRVECGRPLPVMVCLLSTRIRRPHPRSAKPRLSHALYDTLRRESVSISV